MLSPKGEQMLTHISMRGCDRAKELAIPIKADLVGADWHIRRNHLIEAATLEQESIGHAVNLQKLSLIHI
eukprot:3539025-Lingulodinium_polyedra.AAC.1